MTTRTILARCDNPGRGDDFDRPARPDDHSAASDVQHDDLLRLHALRFEQRVHDQQTRPIRTCSPTSSPFRRAYFTYENKISNDLKLRFRSRRRQHRAPHQHLRRHDPQSSAVPQAHLPRLGRPAAQLKLNLGMIETLFKLAEDHWGLRSVAALVDGYKDIAGADIRQSSADLGLT